MPAHCAVLVRAVLCSCAQLCRSSRSIRHPQCYPLGTLTVPIRCIDELLDFQPPVYGEEPVQMLPDDKSWEWAAKKGAVVLRLLGVQWHPAIMAAMATPLA